MAQCLEKLVAAADILILVVKMRLRSAWYHVIWMVRGPIAQFFRLFVRGGGARVCFNGTYDDDDPHTGYPN